jgi:cytochrome d ubiquinol oxidase subunit II
VLLLRDASRGARLAAIGAVAAVIGGWGAAQWPYLLPTSLTVSAAAAPAGTLTALVVAVVLVVLIVLPALALLYALDQKHLLPEEGVEDVGDGPLGKPAG